MADYDSICTDFNHVPCMASLEEGPQNLDSADDDALAAYESVYRMLAEYAHATRAAREQHREGRTHIAYQMQQRADDIYRRLPGWARW